MYKRSLWRRWRYGIVIMLCFSLAAGLLYCLALLEPHFDDRKFDRQLWLSQPASSDRLYTARIEMAGDIVRNQIRPGMPLKEVVDLLGPGDREAKSGSEYPAHVDLYCHEQSSCEGGYSYFLGGDGTYHLILLCLDKNDRVLSAQVISYSS